MAELAPVEGQTEFDWQDVKGRRVAQVNYNTEVVTYGGERLAVNKGDWIVEAGRPDQYAKVNVDEFDQETDEEATERQAEEAAEVVEYNPTDHNVADVHEHLNAARTNQDETEFNRIIEVEKSEKRRAGIVNQSF